MICYFQFNDETGEPCGKEAVTVIHGCAMCEDCAKEVLRKEFGKQQDKPKE